MEHITSEKVTPEKGVKCPKCGQILKTRSGLAGHMKIMHGVDTRRTYPDEISQRLKAIENVIDNLVLAHKEGIERSEGAAMVVVENRHFIVEMLDMLKEVIPLLSRKGELKDELIKLGVLKKVAPKPKEVHLFGGK